MYVTVELVVGVLDLVERRLLELLRLARVDLDPVLLAVLLRALQHALAKFPLRRARIAWPARRRTLCVDSTCQRPSPPIDSFAVTLKFVFSCAFSTIWDSTRDVSLDSVRRVCRLVLELLRRPRLLGDLPGRVAPDLLRRERNGGDQVADLVVLGLPRLPVRHHDPEVDRSSSRRRRTRSARAASSLAA